MKSPMATPFRIAIGFTHTGMPVYWSGKNMSGLPFKITAWDRKARTGLLDQTRRHPDASLYACGHGRHRKSDDAGCRGNNGSRHRSWQYLSFDAAPGGRARSLRPPQFYELAKTDPNGFWRISGYVARSTSQNERKGRNFSVPFRWHQVRAHTRTLY